MSDAPDEEKLEQLRQQKMEQLQEQAESGQGEGSKEAAQQQADAQKQALLRQHLTDDARKRLNTVKMSKPQFGQQVEQQVIALARSGRMQGKIDDDKMKQLLKELKPDSKSFDIKRR
ncbi:DNA-binding protein [Natrarchaeobius halalkaliphilus]|uniref:DNA-binding protein EA462_12240 n=1 Tax=Natrarchaeobius halalkaliphilus TaxID=1679091 RepID=A0A3N6LQB0_9EURY|nr:DNA-binding protein [Natrarchaeobius halalkaliphilus]RQG89134.1 DNA-binding protein [Natrarchaeobius halalkaliphilus]